MTFNPPDLARVLIAERQREADHLRQARLTHATRHEPGRQHRTHTSQSFVLAAFNLVVTVLLGALLLSGALAMLLVETAGGRYF